MLCSPRAYRALLFGLPLLGCAQGGDEPAGFGGVRPDDCLDGTAGLHHGNCAGLQFDLSVPGECLTRACGLIVDLHGATMTGQQQEANTSLGALTEGRGYLVLQPWAPGTPSWWDVPDDALDAQVLALAERAMNVFDVDRRRVHVTGFSQGGYMTWRMLCRQPNLFASYAPIAATAEQVLGSAQRTGAACVDATATLLAPRPVLYAHGTADPIVDFSGADASVELLRTAWGLPQQEVLDAGEHYAITRYSGDGAGLIEFVRHDLRSGYAEEVFGAWEGHCFPGSDDAMGCGAGPAWGEAVLRFFEAHPSD